MQGAIFRHFRYLPATAFPVVRLTGFRYSKKSYPPTDSAFRDFPRLLRSPGSTTDSAFRYFRVYYGLVFSIFVFSFIFMPVYQSALSRSSYFFNPVVYPARSYTIFTIFAFSISFFKNPQIPEKSSGF